MAIPKGANARGLAVSYGFPLNADFHSLTASQAEAVISAADACGYRKPKNANGSRGRYFHAALRRNSNKEG